MGRSGGQNASRNIGNESRNTKTPRVDEEERKARAGVEEGVRRDMNRLGEDMRGREAEMDNVVWKNGRID